MKVDWLDNIVVSTQIQAKDSIRHRVTGRQYQHRCNNPAPTQSLQHLQPVFLRQSNIQHRCSVIASAQFTLGGNAIANPIHLKTKLTQTCTQAVAQHRVIFSQQNSHQRAPG